MILKVPRKEEGSHEHIGKKKIEKLIDSKCVALFRVQTNQLFSESSISIPHSPELQDEINYRQ